MTPLARLLNAAKSDRSVDSFIAEAERRGVEVSRTARSNIYKAMKGDHAKNPHDTTLQLWAAVFRLDVRDLRAAAGKARGELGPWRPTDEANRLSQDQRDAIDALIKTIVRAAPSDDVSTEESDDDPVNPYTQAARELAELDQEPPPPPGEKRGERHAGA